MARGVNTLLFSVFAAGISNIPLELRKVTDMLYVIVGLRSGAACRQEPGFSLQGMLALMASSVCSSLAVLANHYNKRQANQCSHACP